MIALRKGWPALVCAAIILIGLVLAEQAPAASTVQGKRVAATSAASTCYSYNPRVTKKNRVGWVLYRMQVNLYWCSNGRRLTYAYASRAWFPRVSAWCCDVLNIWSPVSRWTRYNGRWHGGYYAVRQAKVKSCVQIPGDVFCKYYYPYIKAEMRYTGKAVLWRYKG